MITSDVAQEPPVAMLMASLHLKKERTLSSVRSARFESQTHPHGSFSAAGQEAVSCCRRRLWCPNDFISSGRRADGVPEEGEESDKKRFGICLELKEVARNFVLFGSFH